MHKAIVIQIWNRFALASLDRGRRTQYVATLTAGVLVGLVLAVGLAITEELLVDALAVAARQFPLRANGFVGLEDGQDLTRLCKTQSPLDRATLVRKLTTIRDISSRRSIGIHRTSID